jgi:hypothetical protein
VPEQTRPDPPADHAPASPESLTAALAALQSAADALSRTAAAPRAGTEEPTGEVGQTSAALPRPELDPDKADYHRSLERRGALVDVEDGLDLGTLPPSVTHVRFRDGRVQRIGFA